MTTYYKVTAIIAAENIIELFMSDIIPRQNILVVRVESEKNEPSKIKENLKPRKPRGSKVETTIRSALGEGEKTRKELVAALENAGLKGGSVAASLANMQKRGEIEKSVDGTYAFAKAAE